MEKQPIHELITILRNMQKDIDDGIPVQIPTLYHYDNIETVVEKFKEIRNGTRRKSGQ